MRAARICVTLGIAVVLALSVVGIVDAAPGSQVKVRAHTLRHPYDSPFHRIHGRLGITNGSSHTVSLRCEVVVVLKGSGTTHKRGSEVVHSHVGAGQTRRPFFTVKIRDVDHDFENVPAKTQAHCKQV